MDSSTRLAISSFTRSNLALPRLTCTRLTGSYVFLTLLYFAPTVCYDIREMPSVVRMESPRDLLMLPPMPITWIDSADVKPDLVKDEDALFCQYKSIYEVELWRCGIVGGKSPANQATITRKMMREARTLDPNYPYLMNASTSPTFGVALVNITDIESIEDGFLSDYPHISMFSIHASNVIKKLKRNMFAGAGDLTFIQIH